MKDRIKENFAGNWARFYKKFLKGVKKIGGHEFKAICPFHDDKDPSFNFSNQTGQYYCHGCGKKGDPIHFYSKLHSLDTRRDFHKILKGISNDFGISWEQQKKRVTKTYDYQDADGKLLFQVCRMEPKDFRQRRPDGNGGWAWNLKGIEPVLYRLPELKKADEIIICEGEKDADNLAALGFCATTCPMGAGKWRESYNEILRGKNIVLIPDNDNQGREHMAKVAASLNGNSASLKLLELPGLPSKGDVSDFIASFQDPDEAGERLAIMIDNAGPYEPPKVHSIEDVVLDISEFRQIEISERKAFLVPWLKTDSINMIYGWRGAGKTWFALGLLDAITKRESFGPWACEKSAPCLFLDGEMTVTDDHERIDDLGLLSKRENPLYIYSDHYASRLGLPKAHLANQSWREKMKSILIARKVKLWVVDNIASLASGLDENKKQDWDPINQWLLELRFAGVCTIMLHHESKEGKQRGTAAREDNLDTSIRLKKPSDYSPEDGARFIVHFAKARVRTSDLQLISDTEFKLTTGESEKLQWTFASVKAQTKNEVLKMIDEGFETKVITEALGITRGYVSQIRKKAIRDGFLTAKGKLTPSGFGQVNG